MLQANKILIRGLLCSVLAIVLIIISIISFPTCGNHTPDSYQFESDTLFFEGLDNTDREFMYLLMEYKIFKKDSVYVKKSFVGKEGVFDYYHYFLLKRNDSLVLIKPVFDKDEQLLDSATLAYLNNSDSVYIDLNKGKIARVDYDLNRLKSELQFVGYELYKDKNGRKDSLIIMYGCNISEGCFGEHEHKN